MPLLGPTLRRGKATPRPRLRALVALLASLALNALLLALLAASGTFRLERSARAPVALAPLSASEWNANRAIREREVPPRAPSGKVVELPPEQPASDEPPSDAKFLSDRNTRVERETVSRRAGNFPRPAPRPEPADATRGHGGARGEAAAGATERRRGRAASPEERGRRKDAPALAPDPSGELALRREGPPARSGGAKPGPVLSLDEAALARIAGGPSMDGFREVEEGDETWLESREFRFATYLNQMRREIGEEWYPRVRDAVRGRDPEGESFFYRERTVVLGIAVAPSGDVKGLSVLESSKIPFVDEIAIASVREAQPFPNPPRAMFEEGAEVRVPFAFTIYPAEGRGAVRWRAPSQR